MKPEVIFLAGLAAASVWAKPPSELEIKPGPSTISPAEAAIVADPSAGSQHGVILVEETVRNENIGGTSLGARPAYEISHHTRAKILSAEGRSLADVEIPGLRFDSDLRTWWGKTILPDGTVLELKEEDLKRQSLVQEGMRRIRTVKAALPGVVPGCVIDYGYVVDGNGYFPIERVVLQKQWPVKLVRYKWIPSGLLASSYVTAHLEGKNVEIKPDRGSVLVTAKDLAPVADEPNMMPVEEVRPTVTLYYSNSSEKPDEYWNAMAKSVESELKRFTGNGSAIRAAIASMQLPPEGSLPSRLEAAYEWLSLNVTNTGLMSAEQEEAYDSEQYDDSLTAKSVLAAKRATPRQHDFLFAGVARALGLEANLVFATDRSSKFWSRGLKSMSQFWYTLVAVRAPGEPDDKIVFVDSGSGLPYGVVPWRATGVATFVCTQKGAQSLTVPPALPKVNREDTKVTVLFGEEGEGHTAKWYRNAGGAEGMDYRRWLRDLDPDEREKAVESLCRGGRTDVEIVSSETPGLSDNTGRFELACDIDLGETGITQDISRYSFSFVGPWWPQTPEFPSATRSGTVVFHYPFAQIVSVDVAAPAGFKTGAVPAPVELQSPFGHYQLVVAKTDTGFHVDRGLVLSSIVVNVPDYPAMRTFFQDVAKHDQASLSFERDRSAR
jgi:hypothetical protein